MTSSRRSKNHPRPITRLANELYRSSNIINHKFHDYLQKSTSTMYSRTRRVLSFIYAVTLSTLYSILSFTFSIKTTNFMMICKNLVFYPPHVGLHKPNPSPPTRPRRPLTFSQHSTICNRTPGGQRISICCCRRRSFMTNSRTTCSIVRGNVLNTSESQPPSVAWTASLRTRRF